MASSVGANETPVAPPPAPTAIVTTTTNAPPVCTNTTRHWRVLRNALVAKTRDETSDATASSRSTEFFPQYASDAPQFSGAASADRTPASSNFEWRSYAVTKGDACKRVLVHEKQKRQKVSLAELFSHKLNAGVDNTGNIRTWPSEQILLAYLLKYEVCRSLAAAKGSPIMCCELGGGMAGLASLGLAAHDGSSIASMLVTDGNPLSVGNLEICIQENVSRAVVPPCVRSELLRWDRTAQFPPTKRHQFDLLFASDCLFFEDFHEDLAYTIRELLRPRSGVCYLLQPSRNGSMERFCAIASSSRHALELRVVQDYDPEITRKHNALAAAAHAEYVPDVHLPVLLEVRAVENVEK